jgi:DNA-binding transcriptional ArsR family regulator
MFKGYELLENRVKCAPRIILMRPLLHPSAEDVTVEGILHALSDPVRAQIFAQIVKANCPQTCSVFLKMRSRNLPKSTLSVHFKVLREAGLIHSERKGVELHNTPRKDVVCEKFGGMIKAIVEAQLGQGQKGKGRK